MAPSVYRIVTVSATYPTTMPVVGSMKATVDPKDDHVPDDVVQLRVVVFSDAAQTDVTPVIVAG